ncbi:YceI family protein [Candidatus Colwellia aromaticivorans]|uniref:YceI family protein n=1 Tax=Candidatus Colwellia aromaticivorans TaxID=2267621 RepID=UPI000DF44463|nr:YceI family protein [Candidatus Colwellia aromaticivorans]
MKKTITKLAITSLITGSMFMPAVNAVNYVIDNKGAHASINFKIKHLGYSWLTGRFDKFDGKFSYDPANVSASKIEVNIDTSSINSNHAERDKHLKSDDFLDVSAFANAKFVSESVTKKADGQLAVTGVLTLHGVSKTITIDAQAIGEGKDPWGGYRAGFSGTTTIALTDFSIKLSAGPASTHVQLDLHIEGIKQ